MRPAVAGLCLLLCIGPPANAQERQLGVKVGLAFASLAIEPPEMDPGYDTSLAAAGGGFFVMPVSRRLAIQLEALFTRKGAKIENALDTGVTNTQVSSTLLLDYLEFPVLARVAAARMPAYSLHLLGGISPGIRIGAKQEIAATLGPGRTGFKDDIAVEVARFEACAIAGAGVDIGRRIVIDGRYSWGLTDINRDPPAGSEPRLPARATVRNRVLMVMAGFRF